jgi:hypothetical protein
MSGWEKGRERLMAEVGIGREDATGFFLPCAGITVFRNFLFEGRESLQQKLTVVTEGNGVLAGEAAGDLVDEDLSESKIDGGCGLEAADGSENVRGAEISIGDAADFAAEVVMAKGRVTRIGVRCATFAIGTKALATSIWNRNFLLGTLQFV